ncbi:MAG: DUF5675 family protein [Acidobacteriota bacterium]|nr:DUF5675 family protein [Acidobacteriota bacterium]
MELVVQRERSTANATPGKLYADGTFMFFTLEDTVREIAGVPVEQWKIPGKTAVPAGRRRIILSQSPRFSAKKPYSDLADGRVPEILNVPGFIGIRAHIGNSATDTDGCLLVGKQRLDAECILRSREAYKELVNLLLAAEKRGEEVWITYKNP